MSASFYPEFETLLTEAYHPPEFDVDLCQELVEQIRNKNQDPTDARVREVAVGITWFVCNLVEVFDAGFINEIDVLIGPEEYQLRVFMSRDANKKI